MEKITIWWNGKQTIQPYTEPMLLCELLPAQFAKTCGGSKKCGKCKVQAYGAISALCAEEKQLLSLEEQLDNVRLACCALALGSCTIRAKTTPMQVQLDTNIPIYYQGPSPFGQKGFVFAADIGTTTVAVWLIDLENTSQRLVLGAANAQAGFGADVISRIEAAQKQGLKPLSDAITNQLDQIFSQLMHQGQISPKEIRGVVLTGNTAMLHFAAGLDPVKLASAPYTPESLFGVMQASRNLFASLPPSLNVYFAPCVSGFVGADLVCALLACKLKPYDLLIDIGTNGEMALLTEEGLLCCSTAAGPAFEGAGLRCGMPATPGAICGSFQQDGRWMWKTIGNQPAVGICGAGAIEALAMLLEVGAIDETGCLKECYAQTGFLVMGEIVMVQEDIRALQLAKGAIAAGVDTLLHHANITSEQVGTLYLAGGFGSMLSVQAAAKIGLLLPELASRTLAVGNAAGMGAQLCSISQTALDQLEQLAKKAYTIDLAGNAYFSQSYIEHMLF